MIYDFYITVFSLVMMINIEHLYRAAEFYLLYKAACYLLEQR